MRLFLDKARARGEHMLPVRTGYHKVWLLREEGACTTERWALDCSATVKVNALRIVCRGTAHIVPGRWIDADDHTSIEKLTVGEKQCPLFCQCFAGVCTFLSSAFNLYSWGSSTKYTAMNFLGD